MPRLVFELRDWLSLIQVQLKDGKQVLCCIIQSERGCKIVAENYKDYRRKHHNPLLHWIAAFGRETHHPDIGRRHQKRQNVNWPAEQREMRHCVRLRKIANPTASAAAEAVRAIRN